MSRQHTHTQPQHDFRSALYHRGRVRGWFTCPNPWEVGVEYETARWCIQRLSLEECC